VLKAAIPLPGIVLAGPALKTQYQRTAGGGQDKAPALSVIEDPRDVLMAAWADK
jgi:hypothetical protein